ncbi:hypothetical protein HID58_035045 [Brassica napus]|uniref:F-box domain-containing protein n=2 Tax=Brassica napus TaxID=3708 RepID=A0ABQ8C3V5_BRANA|nr:hypothetical protein HID58_035045 [Brassica napus]CDY30645.1 BnaAnng04200D [Brassica napus]
MGSVMSLSCSKRKATSQDEEPSNSSRKRRKLSSSNDEEDYNCRLIPNLPDELSIQILARLPRISYSSVRLVSRRWRSAVSTSEVYALRKELGITEEWLYVLTKGQDDKLLWYSLDPVSTRWQRLPPMPVIVYEEESRRSSWNLKVGEVPVYDMTDSESPYLLAGFHGKLHFITRDHNRNVTVLRADVPDVSGSSSSSSSSSKCVIASKDLGAAELVSCQVIDI